MLSGFCDKGYARTFAGSMLLPGGTRYLKSEKGHRDKANKEPTKEKQYCLF